MFSPHMDPKLNNIKRGARVSPNMIVEESPNEDSRASPTSRNIRKRSIINLSKGFGSNALSVQLSEIQHSKESISHDKHLEEEFLLH